MRKDNPDLVGYAVAAVFAGIFIYHFYKYLLIALAIIGLWFLFDQHNRKGPPHC